MNSRPIAHGSLLLFVIAGCGAAGAGGGSAGSSGSLPLVASAPSASTQPGLVATETDATLRDRALAALDAGDLEAADPPLRELVRRSPSAGTIGLLNAVDAITGRDRTRAHPFANVRPIRVSAVREPPASGKPSPLVPKRRKASGIPDLGDQRLFPGATKRTPTPTREPAQSEPPIPLRFAGNDLLLTRPSEGRWLALYGRDRSDARFVAVLGADGAAEAVFDFAAWRAKNQIAEAGIAWADLAGDTLYLKTEVMAYDGFVAAVDRKTGNTAWRSEVVAFASNFVVGTDQVVVWRWQPTNAILAFDKRTGATVARATMAENPARYLVASHGVVEAHDVAQLRAGEVFELKVATTESTATRAPLPKPVPTKRIAAQPCERSEDRERRRRAWELLDADDPRAALLIVREILERQPGNFAVGALFDTADERLAAARASVSASAAQVVPLRVRADAPVGRAPIARGPKAPVIRVVEEREYRRHHTAWFAENDVTPNAFDRDTAPSQHPVNPAPAWLAETFAGESWTEGVSADDHAVAVYGHRHVIAYRDGKALSVLDFGPRFPRPGAYVVFADLIGDVVIASADFDGKAALVALDAKTGNALWRTPVEGVGSFVFVDGHVVAMTGSKEIVVVEGDTGRIASRVKTPKAYPMSYRLARKGNTIFGFDSVLTARFAIE